MVNISRKTLSGEKMTKILRLLYELSGYFQDRDRFYLYIDELFTPKEKIILLKRVALIYLIVKKMDQKSISESLNLSSETVSKFALIYKNRNTEIIKIMQALVAKEKTVDFMSDILTVFFFPSIYSTSHLVRQRYEKMKSEKKRSGF
jgi:uncharacterized protein YerC